MDKQPPEKPCSTGRQRQPYTILLPGIPVAGDGVKNGWEFVNQAPPPSFYSQDAALKNYDWVRAHATEILPGHDRPFRLETDGSIAYLHEAVPVTLTLYADPGQNPKTVPLP